MYYTYQVTDSEEEHDNSRLIEVERPHSKNIPEFETLFEEDKLADRDAVRFMKEPMEEAIDDYFNFENPDPNPSDTSEIDLNAPGRYKEPVHNMYKQAKFEKNAVKRFGLDRPGFYDKVDLYLDVNEIKGVPRWSFDGKNKGIYLDGRKEKEEEIQLEMKQLADIFGKKGKGQNGAKRKDV